MNCPFCKKEMFWVDEDITVNFDETEHVKGYQCDCGHFEPPTESDEYSGDQQ